MTKPRPTLRRVLPVAIMAVACLAAIAATVLVVATSVLYRSTADMVSAVESVRTVEEAEINLLLHSHGRDPLLQRQLEGALRQDLLAATDHVTDPTEQELLRSADGAVATYLESAGTESAEASRRLMNAFDRLEQLVDHNVSQAQVARERAAEWNALGNTLGIVLGSAILVVTTAVVLWLRVRVLRPMLALSDTMRRFGIGERSVRAREDGPREVAQMSARFNEMADALAMQRKLQVSFLGGIAHDLRTPLSALRLAVDVVEPDGAAVDEAQLRRTLALMNKQIDALDRMVSDFLDMSKIEAGQLELRIERHDVRAIVRDSAELFSTGARGRVRLQLSDGAVIAPCDPVRMGQALTNLISNGLKYSPKHERVEVALRTQDGCAVLEVTDHGIGIPREDHRRIFEPFQRVSQQADVPGTGLGLYNVQRIVQAHGGSIEVESVPSVGSTFRVRLPLAPTAAPEPTVFRPWS